MTKLSSKATIDDADLTDDCFIHIVKPGVPNVSYKGTMGQLRAKPWLEYEVQVADLATDSGTVNFGGAGEGFFHYEKRGKTVTLNYKIDNMNFSDPSVAMIEIAIPVIIGVPTRTFFALGKYINNDNPTYGIGSDLGTTVAFVEARASGVLHFAPIVSSAKNFYTNGNECCLYGQITFEIE